MLIIVIIDLLLSIVSMHLSTRVVLGTNESDKNLKLRNLCLLLTNCFALTAAFGRLLQYMHGIPPYTPAFAVIAICFYIVLFGAAFFAHRHYKNLHN